MHFMYGSLCIDTEDLKRSALKARNFATGEEVWLHVDTLLVRADGEIEVWGELCTCQDDG